jgi:hypothetical protein
MAYTSPTKVAQVVEWNRQGVPPHKISKSIGIHRTAVTRILKQFEKSGDYYQNWPFL